MDKPSQTREAQNFKNSMELFSQQILHSKSRLEWTKAFDVLLAELKLGLRCVKTPAALYHDLEVNKQNLKIFFSKCNYITSYTLVQEIQLDRFDLFLSHEMWCMCRNHASFFFNHLLPKNSRYDGSFNGKNHVYKINHTEYYATRENGYG